MHGKLHKTNTQGDTDKVILHIGTKDLRSTRKPLEVASDIIDLVQTWKEDGCDAVILEILLKSDKLN